ncbi:GH92 family glycosyl hydrolase [Aureibacter tunicatorum]|uniref:Alpha-1,2-mannosidase n=1 Tax=Aureibacter tunicatorum TaxID=866807 RepID=A0AAE3XIZ1_9BACT|nr:GH92 family glycosyl hydrolase [Aureibacter tunicatorum]MDR6238611.1 putative alpha-1,2-mannosidase [Aureibacter tunicatorum]BDD05458.1 hypothetical protein AUTU_29410 [Aureibacter tunicatorum]
MSNRLLLLSLTLLAIVSCKSPQSVEKSQPRDLTKYVNPLVGTDGHGHTHPSAMIPFGAVQVGPSNFNNGWDWCSGYHYTDSSIAGFSHLHLSGTGIGDLGDVLIMPTVGDNGMNKGEIANPDTGFRSRFTHDREVAEPGYYSVDLLDYNIKAEMTATQRVAYHKYTFPKSDESNIIIDLRDGIGWDLAKDTYIKVLDDKTIEGYRHSTGWANEQNVYFVAQFSKSFEKANLYSDTVFQNNHELKDQFVKAKFDFNTQDGETIDIKVGISAVSIENARKNIDAEIPHWSFEQTRQEAKDIWNEELSRIEATHSDEERLRTFYTAMYHAFLAPMTFNDIDGKYRGSDREIHNGEFTNYTTFSLWDTYRASHPLFTIVQREKVDDFINSMLAQYDETGLLPVWSLMGNETNTMIGYHAVPVIVDAYLKGFRGFDVDKAYKAIKASALQDERGLKYIKEIGYIPAEKEIESVAKALEYAIDDFGIAQMAKALGEEEDYKIFSQRAKAYQHYFDENTGFMRGKMADGSWRTPFDPVKSSHRDDDYCEGNAWQYTWLVPHDVKGLIELFGSDEAFVTKLDSLFIIDSGLLEGSSPDITGLIGQYAQGNEPSHHVAYLYNYAGKAYKTQEMTRRIMSTFFDDTPHGLPGNEDCGQMSAWYVFSSMGFYPVNPMSGIYALGSPEMEHVSIPLENGNTFEMTAHDNSAKNIYIQSAKLNGVEYNNSFITHEQIMNGGKLELFMGPKPNTAWATNTENRPFFNQK